MWANKHIFDSALAAPLLHRAPKKPIPMEDPVAAFDLAEAAAAAREDGTVVPAAAEEETVAAMLLRRHKSTERPLAPGALTLSGLPANHLHAIAHIDEIKEQSKVSIHASYWIAIMRGLCMGSVSSFYPLCCHS